MLKIKRKLPADDTSWYNSLLIWTWNWRKLYLKEDKKKQV